MGKYTAAAKNAMLNELGTLITHVGLHTAGTAVTGITGEADTDLFTKVGHGFTNGDLVILTELSGGTGLNAGDANNANEAAWPYFIVGVSGNDFQISHTAGGAAVAFSTDVTAVKMTELTEISGGSPAYSREAIAWNAASIGSMDDSTNGAVFDVPAAAVVDYVGYWSASTNGTCYAIDKVTQETFGGQGTYTLTDADLDLNAS